MKKHVDKDVLVNRLFASYARLEHQLRDHLHTLPVEDQQRLSRLHSHIWIDVFAPCVLAARRRAGEDE